MKFSPRLRNRFRKAVTQLGQRRAYKLLRIVESARGRQPELRRKWRDGKINELQGIVERAYLPHLRRWVRKQTDKTGVRFNRGRVSKDAKASEVRDRLLKRWGKHRHLAYVSFAGRRRCLKVGRSDTGFGRIVSQQDAYYFRDASRVDVYFPKSEKRRMLPALECALTHLFLPYHYYQKPAKRKYRKTCAACHAMKLVSKIARELYPA
jgi:site-specific DNA-cytosine methylase